MTPTLLVAAALVAGLVTNVLAITKALACVDTHCAVTVSGPIRGHVNGRVVSGHFSMTVQSRVVGGRPNECRIYHRGRLIPYCGCAMSLRYFGRVIPHLKLAANWKRFPRTAPAPGMVAARRGHVFQLLQHVSGSDWKVWDPNSGRGRIHEHVRSLAGYTVHDPSGGRG